MMIMMITRPTTIGVVIGIGIGNNNNNINTDPIVFHIGFVVICLRNNCFQQVSQKRQLVSTDLTNKEKEIDIQHW